MATVKNVREIIPDPAISRLCWASGFGRVSSDSYAEIRAIMYGFTSDLLMKMHTLMEYNRRKIVTLEDLLHVLTMLGMHHYAGHAATKVCKSISQLRASFTAGGKTYEGKRVGQDCLVIAPASFSKYAKGVCETKNIEMKFKGRTTDVAGVMEELQFIVEHRVREIVGAARAIANASPKSTTTPKFNPTLTPKLLHIALKLQCKADPSTPTVPSLRKKRAKTGTNKKSLTKKAGSKKKTSIKK